MESLRLLIEAGVDVNLWDSVWTPRHSNADGSFRTDPDAWSSLGGKKGFNFILTMVLSQLMFWNYLNLYIARLSVSQS